jgi:hypothetical protein
MKIRLAHLAAAGSLAVFSVTLAAASQEKVQLHRRAKVGDVSRHAMEGSMTMNVNGQQVTVDMQGTEKITVKAVAADGAITMEGQTESMTITMNGNAVPAPPLDSSTLVVKPDGTLVSFKSSSSGDGTEVRLHAAMSPIFPDQPLGVGEAWTRDIAADAARGVPAARAEMKLVGFEKIGATDTAKVTMKYTETGGSGVTSTVVAWLDRATGEQVKVEAEVQNLPMSGMGTVTMIMRQTKLPAGVP